MKKLLTGAAAWLTALTVLAAPAGAILGPLAVAVDETEISVHNFNMGLVSNHVFARANSGWNLTIGDGAAIDTGNAEVGAGIANTVNTNNAAIAVSSLELGPIAINLGYYADGVDAQNSGGGPICPIPGPCWLWQAVGYWMMSGQPVAIAWDNTSVEVGNVNLAFVGNDLTLLANSGYNFTLGDGVDVETGDASVDARVANTVNTNNTAISVVEGGVGPVAANVEFGYGAPGEAVGMPFPPLGPLAVAVEEDEISVHNFNMGVVCNHVFARANSGWNMTIGGDAQVETGAASVASGITNNINTNNTAVTKTDMGVGPIAVNADLSCGSLESGGCYPVPSGAGVGPVAANIGTGGVAVAVETDKVEVENDNMAIIKNDETLVANSGNNVTIGCSVDVCPKPSPSPCPSPTPDPCAGCCGGGCSQQIEPTTSVVTGDATVETTVTNTANTNTTTITVSE